MNTNLPGLMLEEEEGQAMCNIHIHSVLCLQHMAEDKSSNMNGR